MHWNFGLWEVLLSELNLRSLVSVAFFSFMMGILIKVLRRGWKYCFRRVNPLIKESTLKKKRRRKRLEAALELVAVLLCVFLIYDIALGIDHEGLLTPDIFLVISLIVGLAMGIGFAVHFEF